MCWICHKETLQLDFMDHFFLIRLIMPTMAGKFTEEVPNSWCLMMCYTTGITSVEKLKEIPESERLSLSGTNRTFFAMVVPWKT